MKVLAIVITYNRVDLLKKCLESLKSSSFVPDILVVDNASKDSTEDFIKNNHKDIFYLKLEQNLGPAGGAQIGQNFALQKDYEAVWMLDDDVIVSKDALLTLLKYYEELRLKNEKIFLSSVAYTDLEFSKPMYNFLKYNPNTGLTSKIKDALFKEEYFEYDIAPMNGLFIPKEVLQDVGTFNGKLWGWYDDTEFVLRCRSKGYRGFAITKSKIYHPVEFRKHVKIFGRTFNILSGRPFRMYLGTRNNVYVQKKFLKPLNFYFVFLPVFFFKRLVSILLFYDNKGVFLKNFLKGVVDGIKGNLEVQNV